MTDFKQSETCLNLMRSFAGESQAHMRYKFFETRAKEEGFHEIETIFKETAMNEMAHAHIFFKFLERHLGPQSVPVNGEYPVELGDTLANLKSAAAGEHDEHANVYPHFAEVARKEGFKDIAHHFDMIAKIEHEHEQRFTHFAKQLEDDSLFKKDSEVYFKCVHCGHVHHGTSAPGICPNCQHPQGYFKVVPIPWQ